MEKLQAALQKARDKRASSDNRDLSREPSPTSHGRKDSKRYAWSSLKEIPLSDKALRNHRVVTRNASEEATPFDILRTKILLQMQHNGWKRLAITSPMPKSGKTTMACNLALGLGRQSGLRAILVDFDLQDPSVGEFFGYNPNTSIVDVLDGGVQFNEHAVRIGENVGLCLADGVEEDPTRFLLASKTEAVLGQIEAEYLPDVTIFDLPSVLSGDNTRAFLKNVDCALIVARSDNTRYSHFDACEREIAEHTSVLGVVLNAFRTKSVQGYSE